MLMWNRVWGIKIRKVHFFTNIYYTVITTTTFSRWFDILYSTFYKQFKYVRDTYQSIYFATLNFQQVSQVEKSGCLMWVSGGKNFFFRIKTRLNRKPTVNQYNMIITFFFFFEGFANLQLFMEPFSGRRALQFGAR